MAHFKLNDADEHFLGIPQDAALLFAGASGTETWIEREHDTVVRIAVKSVATATADGGSLGVAIDIGGATAKGQDGPAASETQLRASQSVQVLVRAGERVAFKAYPTATSAHVLRTVVWAADLKRDQASDASAHQNHDRPSPGAPGAQQQRAAD